MTNKLVVIVNNLKVPKIKKILLYETKFIVPNYSCLQNPWLGGGGYHPKIPVRSVLCPQLTLLNSPPPKQNSWVRHCEIPNTIISEKFVRYTRDDNFSRNTYEAGYTGRYRRNPPYFGKTFLRLIYIDITKHTYIWSWAVTEIIKREK